jgi:lipopolysaccharide transport system permease protein
MSRSAASIVGNASIVKQMALPLELFPIKTLAGPLVFGGVSLTCLVGYAAWVTGGSIIRSYLVGLPVLIPLTVILLAGISVALACAQVFIRDLKEFISVFLAVGLFVHPILYFPEAIPIAVRPIIYASPLSYLLFCWQDVMFYGAIVHPWAWLVASVFSIVLLLLATRMFVVSKTHFGDFL